MLRKRLRLFLCFFCVLCVLCLSSPGFGPAFISAFQGAVAEPANPFRFAVIGDSGSGDEGQYRIGQRMAEWHARRPFGLVLMLGDNIYGGVFNLGGGNKKDFVEKFDRPYAELLRRGVVFRAALGNHDVQTRDGRDVIESYERFHIERPEGYYSFTAGALPDGSPLVEFFVINTLRLEEDKKDPEQLAWLEQALKASRARWQIVYGHHPMYSTGKRHGADEEMRAKLEPVLTGEKESPEAGASGLRGGIGQPRVQAVLAGHDHIYQRFHPQKGIAYFVCGSSGKLRRGNAKPSGDVAAVNDRERVFMLWEATPEELRFYAVNERGEAFDCGVLRHGQPLHAAECGALTASPKEASEQTAQR
ncbi:MAG TPA: metallophosphoesterase [Candidatus Xenobia bacterium]|nr:metallophosphoesterase [Candidatus Xenobia bacterium]